MLMIKSVCFDTIEKLKTKWSECKFHLLFYFGDWLKSNLGFKILLRNNPILL